MQFCYWPFGSELLLYSKVFRNLHWRQATVKSPAGLADLGGIIAVLAGVVVLAWPFSSIVALALVTGIWLVIIGVARIVCTFRARTAASAVERGVVRLTSAVRYGWPSGA